MYYHRCFMWRLSTAACTCQERKCITTGVLCGGCQHLSGEEVYYHRCFMWRLSTAACTCQERKCITTGVLCGGCQQQPCTYQEGKCITTGVLCGGCQHLSGEEVYYHRCFMWRLLTPVRRGSVLPQVFYVVVVNTCQERKCITTGVLCGGCQHLSGEEVYYHRCFMWRLSTPVRRGSVLPQVFYVEVVNSSMHLSGEEVYYHRCFTWRLLTAACTCQEGKCITTGVLCGGCQHLSGEEVYYHRCFMWRLSTAACTCQEGKCITTGVLCGGCQQQLFFFPLL